MYSLHCVHPCTLYIQFHTVHINIVHSLYCTYTLPISILYNILYFQCTVRTIPYQLHFSSSYCTTLKLYTTLKFTRTAVLYTYYLQAPYYTLLCRYLILLFTVYIALYRTILYLRTVINSILYPRFLFKNPLSCFISMTYTQVSTSLTFGTDPILCRSCLNNYLSLAFSYNFFIVCSPDESLILGCSHEAQYDKWTVINYLPVGENIFKFK